MKKAFSFSFTLNVPNLLSLFRLSLTPFFIIALTQGNLDAALFIFFLAALTDSLDGLTARLWGQKTPLGRFLDPMADKILMTAAFITLSLPLPHASLRIPWWLTILVIFRDVSIASVAFLIHVVTGFSNFMPSIFGKISTTTQLGIVILVLFANHGWVPISFITPFFYVTLFFTLLSGFHYLFSIRYKLEKDTS